MNPFGISGYWRIDPDNRQDRGSGQVTTYKLSPEEIDQIFNQAQASKKAKESGIMKLDIDVNKLLEVCRIHGTGREGYKAVAEKFSITEKQAESQVYLKKIRRLLAVENTSQNQSSSPAPDVINKAAASEIKPDVSAAGPVIGKVTEPVLSAEDDLFERFKSIVNENKKMKAMTAENEVLKSMLTNIHDKLQEIIAEIKKGGQIE